MTQILRQSTQVIVRIGPAVAVGDGFTPVTTLDLSTADEAELLKANTTTTASIAAATFAAITGCDGWYGLTLTTSHTDTVGCLDVMVNDDSLILPIFARFQVIEEAAYDAIYAASADPKADINVASIDAGAITATAIATGAIDADSLAADAGTEIATAVWANATRTLSALDEDSTTLDLDATIRAAVGLAAADLDTQLAALPTAAENADAVWDEDATGHQTGGTFGQAIGDPAADTNTIYGAVVTGAAGATVAADIIAVKAETATIVADTNELQTDWANGGRLDLIIDAILVDTGTTLDGKIDTIDTNVDSILVDTAEIGAAGAGLTALATQTSVNTVDTVVDAIKVQTDKLTFTVANQVDSNVQSVNDVTITGDGSGTPFNV